MTAHRTPEARIAALEAQIERIRPLAERFLFSVIPTGRRPRTSPKRCFYGLSAIISAAFPRSPRFIHLHRMTIAAAYLTSEGVVLGADSKTTYVVTGASHVDRQLLDHAQKVYEIGQSSRFGLCTFGLGKVGEMSHRTIAAKVADAVDLRQATLDEVVAALVVELETWARALSAVPWSPLGYFVGGVDPRTRTPRCARIALEFGTDSSTGKPVYKIDRFDLPVGACHFDGAPDYFARIFRGYAPGLPIALRDELKQRLPGLPPDFDATFDGAFNAVLPRFVSAGVSDLPLREAIDFVHMYLQLTVKAFKFKIGPPLCGGPVEIAYISTDREFRWARHKLFDSAIRENDTWTR